MFSATIGSCATIGGHTTIFFGGSQVNRRNHIARSGTIGCRATIGGHATNFLAVAKLIDATILPGAEPYKKIKFDGIHLMMLSPINSHM